MPFPQLFLSLSFNQPTHYKSEIKDNFPLSYFRHFTAYTKNKKELKSPPLKAIKIKRKSKVFAARASF